MAIKKQRSPSYPGIPLKEAIDRAKTFFKKEGKHETLVPTAITHWGYSTKSSGGLVAVAALKAYGLMDDMGSGTERKVFLTPFGLKLIMDERVVSPDRDAGWKQAALTPKIMNELWEKYGADLPSHDTLRHFLRVEKDFNENAVKDVIKIYTENLAFAGLDATSVVDVSDQDPVINEEMSDMSPPNPTSVSHTSFIPPMRSAPPPQVIPAGEEIGNYRVSKNTTIRLISSGPYSRNSIESLVKQLQLAIDLGNFDDLSEPEDA